MIIMISIIIIMMWVSVNSVFSWHMYVHIYVARGSKSPRSTNDRLSLLLLLSFSLVMLLVLIMITIITTIITTTTINLVSTSGVTADFMFFFDAGTFWVLPLTYFYLPSSARAHIFTTSLACHQSSRPASKLNRPATLIIVIIVITLIVILVTNICY